MAMPVESPDETLEKERRAITPPTNERELVGEACRLIGGIIVDRYVPTSMRIDMAFRVLTELGPRRD